MGNICKRRKQPEQAVEPTKDEPKVGVKRDDHDNEAHKTLN